MDDGADGRAAPMERPAWPAWSARGGRGAGARQFVERVRGRSAPPPRDLRTPTTSAPPAAPRELLDRQLHHPNHPMDHPICISGLQTRPPRRCSTMRTSAGICIDGRLHSRSRVDDHVGPPIGSGEVHRPLLVCKAATSMPVVLQKHVAWSG